MKPLSGEKILVVYDSRAIRETLSLLGDTAGDGVIESDNPDDALTIVDREHPALVLICAMAAKTHAYRLCRHIKDRYPGPAMPVMLLSLQDTPESAEQARVAGADDALLLSISTEELMRRIRALLRTRSMAIQSVGSGCPCGDVLPELKRLTQRLSEHETRFDKLAAGLEEQQKLVSDLLKALKDRL